MNEIEYIDSIDACFPYEDEDAWRAAVDQGISISDNAAYMALYEICRGVGDLPLSALHRMLDYWDAKYDHPTKPTVMVAVRAVFNDTYLSEAEALAFLDEIAAYPGQCNALGIVWHAAPRDAKRPSRATEAVERRLEEIWKKIAEEYKPPAPADGSA